MTDAGPGRRAVAGSTMLVGRRKAAVALQAGSALISGLSIAWLFYGQRLVLEVGGSCASGGPYVNAVECPDGTWMMAAGVPFLLLTTILGTMLALTSATPPPVFLIWSVLFTSLGANFLDHGFSEPAAVSWILCGVVFVLMAVPAWGVVLRGLLTRPGDAPGQAATRINWTSTYLFLGALGWALGWWSCTAWS